jgi:hypothetical protein
MIVDLNVLPYRLAISIIQYCVDNNIDVPKCLELVEAMTISPPPKIEWTLDIPEKHLTWLTIKYC